MVGFEGLGMEDVEPGVPDMAASESLDERGFVDQRSARGVDQDHARLCPRQLLGPDERACFIVSAR